MPSPICYGMKIRLRHETTGGLLSASERVYAHEGTSAQNIVGGSAKKSPETIWLVKPSHELRAVKIRVLNEQVDAARRGEWPALTKEQVTAWAEKLVAYKLGNFQIAYRDGRALELGRSLYEIGQLRKWPSQADAQVAVDPGLTIFCHQDDPAGRVLAGLFEELGYPVRVESSSGMNVGVIQVTIGQKP